MSPMSRFFASILLAGGAVASISLAPLAAADPALPTPGSSNARDTLNQLRAAGYNVQINWVNGVPDVGLSQCWVNNIDTADATGSLPTVYVDVECPR
jgi:hypothetical protein